MSDLFDTALREKYKQYFTNDPLAFMKDAIDWSAFPPLLRDLYHNDTDKGGKTKYSHNNNGEGSLPSVHLQFSG